MNLTGLLAGMATLFIIGLGFVWVILGERYLGWLWWPYYLGVGILLIALSLASRTDWISILIGVVGATLVWGSTELKNQALRAELGWFPFREKRWMPPFALIIKRWKAPDL